MCMGGLGFLSLSSIVLSAVFIWNGIFSLWNGTCNVYVCLNHTKSDSDQEHAILPTIYKRCTTKMNLSIILSPKCNHKHKSNAVVIDLWCILSRCRQPHGFHPLQMKLKGKKSQTLLLWYLLHPLAFYWKIEPWFLVTRETSSSSAKYFPFDFFHIT